MWRLAELRGLNYLREGSDKTMIMIMKTGSFYQKQKVLQNAKKLGGKGPWQKVFINKDMTKAERAGL